MPTAKEESEHRRIAGHAQGWHGLGTVPRQAVSRSASWRRVRDLWTQYMRGPADAVLNSGAHRKAAPAHWSVVKLQELVTQRVSKAAPPLSASAVWSAVLASPEGKVLVDAYYTAHPHLRRQG